MNKRTVLRPEGVIITGKAFGNGIYFAPRAKKSIGYSSLLGSYWTGGTQHKGYLAVYKVLFKNQKDVDVYHPIVSETSNLMMLYMLIKESL